MSDERLTRFDIPAPVLAVGKRVALAGGELFIVGGWVRDAVRGVDCHDLDLATDLPPDQLKQAVSGIGATYDLGERFGTVGLRAGDYTIEITTYRSDKYSPGSRHPEVELTRSIEEDLSRRDFTINALALSVAPDAGELLDLFDGRGDIKRGVIRAIGEPARRMTEDPLRMMRAVRFAAQLGYALEPGLHSMLDRDHALLEEISRERRRDELEKIVVSPSPDLGVRVLVTTGLMDHVAPEVSAMRGVSQPTAYHRADVLEHTLLTMTYLEPDPLLRRAALFHDVGKPPAKVTEPKTMFPEHDKLSESLSRQAMRRLRYGNEDIQKTAFLVRHHMRPIHYRGQWSDAAVKRMIRDCTLLKDDRVVVGLEMVMELARADIMAGSFETTGPNLEFLEELGGRVAAIRARSEVERARSPLDGRELMKLFDRGPGPWIKGAKEHLADLVLTGELSHDDKEGAEKKAREFFES